MVQKIMVPVDLAHAEALQDALDTATALARTHSAELTLAGVTGPGPSAVAHNSAEYAEKLAAFAESLSSASGVDVTTEALVDNDPAVDLGEALIQAGNSMGADLIIMASHRPGMMEHVFASNAGYVASHAKCSVYVVR